MDRGHRSSYSSKDDRVFTNGCRGFADAKFAVLQYKLRKSGETWVETELFAKESAAREMFEASFAYVTDFVRKGGELMERKAGPPEAGDIKTPTLSGEKLWQKLGYRRQSA